MSELFTLQYEWPRPLRLVSLNERMHWAKEQQHKSAWLDAGFWLGSEVKADCRRKHIRTPLPYCSIQIDCDVHEVRRRDGHNMAKCAKWLIDGLVLAKVFTDDSTEYLELKDWTFNVKKTPPLYMRITITEDF